MSERKVSKAGRRKTFNDGLEAAAKSIPTTWLDGLLTGPKAVVGKPPYGCPDIERLMSALQSRIRALVEAARAK